MQLISVTRALGASSRLGLALGLLALGGCSLGTEAGTSGDNAALTGDVSIWSASATPRNPSDPDTAAVELGLKFRSDVSGTVRGVRFYKSSLNTGTHVGHLWSRGGQLLASVTFTGETASGWQSATFASPVAITANTTYVISYYAPRGHYAGDNDALATAGVDTPPLHALRSGVDGANGVYRYGTGGGFPSNSWRASNYWVDVVFAPGTSSTDAGTPSTDSGTGTTDAGTPSTDSGTGTTDAGTPPPTDSGTPSGACDRTATDGASLASQFAAATGGQTICLAAGNYGTFTGGAKTGRVTIRPQTGAAVTMAVDFRSAQNITIDGVTISSLALNLSRDITVSHCRFTGQAIVRAGVIANANLIFDGNDHRGVLTCSTCFAAQLHLTEDGPNVSGVVIRNSRFGGNSYADGVRPDVNTVLIEDNEFSNFTDVEPYHTDPIQLYGGRRVTIRRNFFHDNAVAGNISAWDGTDHNIIEDNVVVGNPSSGEAIAMLSDVGSVIQHNTLVQGQCAWNWRCGIIDIDHKTDDPASTGTIVRDNITAEIRDNGAMYTADHNLFTGSQTPVYVGPTSTYAGYRLAAGSPGKGAASDGRDIGIR